MNTNIINLLKRTYTKDEFSNYLTFFDKTYKNWKNDFAGLMEELLLSGNSDALDFFLLNEDKIRELIKEKINHDDSYYIGLFNNIDSNWKNNIDKLVKKLVKSQDHESLNFLIKNYENLTDNMNMFDKANLLNQINYYIGFYGRDILYNYGITFIKEPFNKGLSSGFFYVFKKITNLIMGTDE